MSQGADPAQSNWESAGSGACGKSRRLAQRRVDFFIAGVQKGGTTALDAMLRDHPQIQMARVKEVHFFDNDSLDWSSPNLDYLHNRFDWTVENVVRGEATPVYIYWRGALCRLKAYNPEARVLVALRHPSFRAFSHWAMSVARGKEPLSFIEAITTGRARVREATSGQHRIFSYVERGYYERQITELKSLFPGSQLHFLRTDLLWVNPPGEIGRIERFLALDAVLKPAQSYVVPLHSARGHTMSAQARALLDELYRPTIDALGALTGLDFDDWKLPDYSEPW